MKKIAIIGGGIIGMTLANYLDTDKFDISLFDDEKNQATKASAGIISPWLSKRRNKKWYQLAKDGAAFFEKMKNDFELTEDVYEKCGTLFLRQKSQFYLPHQEMVLGLSNPLRFQGKGNYSHQCENV